MSKGADAREDNDGAWFLDQVGKSEFFHQQLHAWGMLEVAKDIEGVQGEGLDWDCATLRISQKAWNRVVHRGIKPVVVFAHPDVLVTIAKATSYYRTLAMVSQKSMARVGLATQSYESGTRTPAPGPALRLARHLNRVISVLIEADETVDAREFDLWRGMAAGTQAQGAWQNIKGDRAEALVKGFVMRRLAEREGHVVADEMGSEVVVSGGLVVRFGDEPDIAVRRRDKVIAAVEVRGELTPLGFWSASALR